MTHPSQGLARRQQRFVTLPRQSGRSPIRRRLFPAPTVGHAKTCLAIT